MLATTRRKMKGAATTGSLLLRISNYSTEYQKY